MVGDRLRHTKITPIAVAVASALAVTAGLAHAARERTTDGCGSRLVFLVWPHGHPAMPRIPEFPHIPNPHIELYRGFNSHYDVALAGAWIIGGKPPPGITRGGFFPACANFGDTITKGTVANARVIKHQTAVKCVFHGSPVTDVALRGGGVADLYVHSGNLLLAEGHVTATSAVLTVPNGRCTLTTPPRP